MYYVTDTETRHVEGEEVYSESNVTDSETRLEKGRRCTKSLTLLTVKHVM